MSVRVKMFATLQETAGTEEVRLEANTVMSVLEQLVTMFQKLEPEIFEDYDKRVLNGRVRIMVNGRNIDYLDGLKTRLIKGDRVAIFRAVAGG